MFCVCWRILAPRAALRTHLSRLAKGLKSLFLTCLLYQRTAGLVLFWSFFFAAGRDISGCCFKLSSSFASCNFALAVGSAFFLLERLTFPS